MTDMDFLTMYQKFTGTSKGFSNYQLKLVNVALKYDETGEKILEEISKDKYENNLSKGLTGWIKLNGGKCPMEKKPVQQSLFASQPASNPATVAPQVDGLGAYMGLLEKTLAEVIVKNQGEAIKQELFGNFEEIAKNFMLENYGKVQKKIEVEVSCGDVKSKFTEVLHSKFETVLKFVKMNEPVFLTGNAGTGKNVICRQVAKAIFGDDDHFYFTNAVTQEYKLNGFTDANGIYHETQFYKAFKNGGLFMLDEMDASCPEALIILNMALSDREYDFPEGKDYDGNKAGGKVKAHPDFRVISAGNTFGLGADYEYVGRNQLDGASLNRFAQVEIDYDRNIELSVADNDEELVNFMEELRTSSRANGIRMIISYRDIGRVAKMKNLLPLEEVLSTCVLKSLRKDDINTLIYSLSDNQYKECMKKLCK